MPGGKLNIWSGSTAALNNKTVKCVGRLNSCLREWRTAQFTTYMDGADLLVKRNVAGQEHDERDEGAGCFYNDGVTNYFASYQTSTTWNGTLGHSVSKQRTTNPDASTILGLLNRSSLIAYRPTSSFFATGYSTGALPTPISTASSQTLSSYIWDRVVALRNDTVLLYDQATGALQYGVLQRSPSSTAAWTTSYLQTGTATTETNYTHVTNIGLDRLMFYNAANGMGRMAKLDSRGVLTLGGNLGFSSGWTHFTGHRSGILTIFSTSSLTAVWASVNENLQYAQLSTIVGGFSSGWTQVEAVGENRQLWYSSTLGTCWLSQVTNTGVYSSIGSSKVCPTNYTALGNQNGQVIFYQKNTSNTQLGTFDAAGALTRTTITAPIGNWPLPGPYSSTILVAAE